jgi:hypothetical protein
MLRSGQPRHLPAAGMETATVAMLEAAGISPAWIYACQHTGGLLPGPTGPSPPGATALNGTRQANPRWPEADLEPRKCAPEAGWGPGRRTPVDNRHARSPEGQAWRPSSANTLRSHAVT